MKISIRILKVLGFIPIFNDEYWSIALNNGYRIIVVLLLAYVSISGSTNKFTFRSISIRAIATIAAYVNLIHMAIFIIFTVSYFQFNSAKTEALLHRINQIPSKSIDQREKRYFIAHLSEFLIYTFSLMAVHPTAKLLVFFQTGTTFFQQCVELFLMSLLKVLEKQFVCLQYKRKSVQLKLSLYEKLFTVISLFSAFILYSNLVRLLTVSTCMNFFIVGDFKSKSVYKSDRSLDMQLFVSICYAGTFPIIQAIWLCSRIRDCSNVVLQVSRNSIL